MAFQEAIEHMHAFGAGTHKAFVELVTRIDKNHDGKVSLSELHSAFADKSDKYGGLKDVHLEAGDLSKIFKALDLNGDGKLLVKEFVDALHWMSMDVNPLDVRFYLKDDHNKQFIPDEGWVDKPFEVKEEADMSHRLWRLRNTKANVGLSQHRGGDFRWVLHHLKFLDAGGQVLSAPQTEGSPGSSIAGSFISSTPPSRVFEDNDNHWSGQKSAEAGEFVGYDFGVPVSVGAFRLKQYAGYGTEEVEVQASDDGATWSTVWTQPVTPQNELNTYTADLPMAPGCG